MRRLASLLALLLLALVPASAYANWCGTPGRDGSPSISGVVNTYYPGTASVAAGATSIPVGASTGAATPIAAGDLLLVIQMQDATIDSRNGSRYGDGLNGGLGSGYTAIGQSGRYEFVRAAGAASGGSVGIVGATGGGLVNGYNQAALSDTSARKSFQVVRVPQYNQITLTGTVSALAWNGSTGGIVAFDVARRLTFSGGTINASGLGFRGGGGRSITGGTGTNTDYATAAASGAHGSKGEGVAGTPRYVANSGSLLDNLLEGYPGGSYARGAPANAGGGGTDGNPAANDQNAGGGGGGNAGAGGQGGYAWCPTGPAGCSQSGGQAGVGIAELAVTRVVMGGGGGAGSSNNASGSPGLGFASSGAAGGGIIFLRAGELAGSGTLSADGASANSTVLNDATGGGGAGGSILVSALQTVSGTSISASAKGGNGGTNTGGGAAHGPGGGGGGGYVASSVTISTSVTAGSSGATQNGGTYGSSYGATGGNGGNGISITGATIPGLSSGGECTPVVTKAFATSPVAVGTTSRMTITVTNNNPNLALTALAFTDTYPSGLTNTISPGATKSCTTGTLTAAASGGSFGVSAASVGAASSCAYAVNTKATTIGDKTNTLAAGAVTGTYGSYSVASLAAASAILSVSAPLTITKVSQAYSDPVRGTTNPKEVPGGFVTYTVTVANPGGGTVDGNTIVIADPTPSALRLFVGNLSGTSGPVQFQDGSPGSGLSYTFTSLASITDDVEFSKDGGTSWTYVPVADATGTDANVTHIRFRPKGTMAANSSFTLTFRYAIK